MKVQRVRPETKRGAINSGLMWWTSKKELDAEMKRRLEIKDRPRESK